MGILEGFAVLLAAETLFVLTIGAMWPEKIISLGVWFAKLRIKEDARTIQFIKKRQNKMFEKLKAISQEEK